MTASSAMVLGPMADALETVSETHGFETSLVVKSVIVGKMMAMTLRQELEKISEDEEARARIEKLVVEVISETIATMCTLQNKEFNKDIIPLVAKVMDADDMKRSLQ